MYSYGKPTGPRHKVFVSYHHANDQIYRDRFERLFVDRHDIMVSKSVQIGDIDPGHNTETIRQIIREDYLRDSTVTVVLVGRETWKRKHVDWEIAASIRDTRFSPRSGLLGIILPTYPGFDACEYDPYTIPPRLYDNIACKFAQIKLWTEDPDAVQQWIHEAYERRNVLPPPVNSRDSYKDNRSGKCWQ